MARAHHTRRPAPQDKSAISAKWTKPIRVAVSGAAGSIANHLLFKARALRRLIRACPLTPLLRLQIASGEVFGRDQPIELQMLGSERSREALEGVAMELEDSLFPLLRQVAIGIDAEAVFDRADWALLIGAKPRGPGMERRDLLDINGTLFQTQGRALNVAAHKDCKVVVVGNPCNTSACASMPAQATQRCAYRYRLDGVD